MKKNTTFFVILFFQEIKKKGKMKMKKKTSLLLKLHGQTWYRWIPQILTHVEYANGFRLGN